MTEEACVRLASAADAQAVSALRWEAYTRDPRARIANEHALDWGESDERSAVLGVWGADGLLATSRWVCVGDAGCAAAEMAVDVPDGTAWFPAIVGARGATRQGVQGHGLTSLLEWHVLDALPGLEVTGVLVTVDSPRLDHFERLGYRTAPTHSTANPDVEPPAPHLAYLPSALLHEALRGLDPHTAPAREDFPWSGPPLHRALAGLVTATAATHPPPTRGPGGACAQ
ncbi:hypothetical protein [Streptomyces sp. NPDC003006]